MLKEMEEAGAKILADLGNDAVNHFKGQIAAAIEVAENGTTQLVPAVGELVAFQGKGVPYWVRSRDERECEQQPAVPRNLEPAVSTRARAACRAGRARLRPDAAAGRSPFLTVGPVVDATLFASIDVGLVIAFDLASGEAKWTSEMAGLVDVAQTIIYRAGALYLNRFQRMGTTSYLSCVNAADGSLVFRHDEDFTPGGCANPIMLDRLFLGGGAQHIAAFDVESREFVWRYEYPGKVRAFGGRPCAVNGGFVATSSDAKKLLWFEG